MFERYHRKRAYMPTDRAQCTPYPCTGYKVPQMPMCFIRGLGKGGNGTVYLAQECPSMSLAVAHLPAKCAVKIFDKATHDLSKIMREIKYHFVAAHHPNILQPYAAWESNTSVFLASEYIRYGDFAKLLNLHGHIITRDDAYLKSLYLQLLDGVAYLHDLGIYHGDLKLENILCKRERNGFRLLLTDFGTSTAQNYIYHRTGYLRGTNYYLPPECYPYPGRETRLVLPCARDIWALGVILYITCVGNVPWDFADPHSDLCYYTFLTNSEQFWLKVPLSRAAKALLKIIWLSKPVRRINIHTLRAMVQHMTEFTTYLPKCSAEYTISLCGFIECHASEHCVHGTNMQVPIEAPPLERTPKIFAYSRAEAGAGSFAHRPVNGQAEGTVTGLFLRLPVFDMADEIHEIGEAILQWFDRQL